MVRYTPNVSSRKLRKFDQDKLELLFLAQDTLERDLIDCNDKIEQMVIRLQDMFREEKLEQKLKADWRFTAITEEAGGVKRHIVMSE